jgi:hypothetical protein
VTPALTWGLIIVAARLASSTSDAADLTAGVHSTLVVDLTLQLSLGAPLVQGGIGLPAGVLIGTTEQELSGMRTGMRSRMAGMWASDGGA